MGPVKWLRSLVVKGVTRVRALPLWVSAPAGVLLFVLLAFGTYTGANTYRYTQEDPNFCQSCHIMDNAWERWSVSEHKETNCHECHEQSKLESMGLVVRYALGQREVKNHPVIANETCTKCHPESSPGDIQNVVAPQNPNVATSLHLVHVEAKDTTCTDCHGGTELHRFAPPASGCRDCHEEKQLSPEMAVKECTECHAFTLSREAVAPISNNAACAACHRSEQGDVAVVNLDNGHGEVYCTQCHQPHVEDKPLATCTECHSPSTAVGIHAWEGHQETACAECHDPHKPKFAPETTCRDCHNKAPVSAPAVPHAIQGKQDCLQCHAPGKPAPLAEKHTATTNEACALCHQRSDEQPARIQHGTEGRQVCASCHKQGGVASVADTHEWSTEGNCQLCHEESTPAPALPHALSGQTDCTSCHAPSESAGALLEDHQGRTDDVCLACHDPSPRWP